MTCIHLPLNKTNIKQQLKLIKSYPYKNGYGYLIFANNIKFKEKTCGVLITLQYAKTSEDIEYYIVKLNI